MKDAKLLLEILEEYNSSVQQPTSHGIPGFSDWGNTSTGSIDKKNLFSGPQQQDVRPEHSALYMKEESVFDLDQPYIKAGLNEEEHTPLFKKRKHPPYYEPALQDDFIAEAETQLTEKVRSKSFKWNEFKSLEKPKKCLRMRVNIDFDF
jgi:hypothetical protein